MGSNAVNLVQEDLCCPVCKKPLSSPGTPPRPKFPKVGRGKGRAPHLHSSFQAHRDTRMAIGKFKDNEEIVIAQCGHLFHKFCLRHYCYLVREGRSNHMYKVCCPCCDRHISMLSQVVDYRAHQDIPNDRDKEFTKTSIMNNELSGQVTSVQNKLQGMKAAIEDGNNNFEIYRSQWRKLRKEPKSIKGKRLEIESLYADIERSEQMLKCMQSQQLKIVKKFIYREISQGFYPFSAKTAPFLHVIQEDDRLVRDLGEIIVPIHLNHLKSDRQSLLKGIISAVHEKLMAKGKEAPSVVTPVHQTRKSRDERSKKPAIFVKVRKSSISILSSTSLTKESIQQIIQKIDIPLHGTTRKRSASVANKNKARQAEKVSVGRKDIVSTTEIKILYMPKRKMIEQTSEPCRTVEDSESFAKVPARKCRSTYAILVKTKKKKETLKGNEVRKPGSKSATASTDEKRSSTADVTSLRSRNKDNRTIPPQDEALVVHAGNATKQDKIRVVTVTSCINNHEAEDNNKISNNLKPCLKCQESKSPKEAQIYNLVPTSPTINQPNETASMLKLIYDNLEEERKSTQNLENHRGNTDWSYLDENNNDMANNFIKHTFATNGNDIPNDSLVVQPSPQFFRVDGRGIARPESPHVIRFRQPTFLTNSQNSNREKLCMKSGYFIPDEENQLDALTPEEKFLIASEYESLLSSRRHGGTSLRRPIMSHGIPACLGMHIGHTQFGTPPEPHEVPFYLKKWQQQLSSRKVLKAIPRRFATSSIRTTRLVNSPRSHPSAHYNYNDVCSRLQSISSYQRQFDREKMSQPFVEGIHLPPLSMYPAKRPSTAQFENSLPVSYQYREGPERDIYDLQLQFR